MIVVLLMVFVMMMIMVVIVDALVLPPVELMVHLAVESVVLPDALVLRRAPVFLAPILLVLVDVVLLVVSGVLRG